SVTGLFGGGSSGEQMFQHQMLEGINQILDNQRIMMKGINALLEGQKQILQALHDIEVQLQKNQQETLARFDHLDSKLLRVQITLVELQSADFDQCSQLQHLGTKEWADGSGRFSVNLPPSAFVDAGPNYDEKMNLGLPSALT